MVADANANTRRGDSAGGDVSAESTPGIGLVPEHTGGSPAIALEGVQKRFNDIYALKGVSVTVEPGQVFGLLGPSGSGKSTLVKLLLGFLQPDEGTVSAFGTSAAETAKARIGYMPERPHYHHTFTGRDYLFFHARMSGLTRAGARRAVDQV